VLESKVQY